MQNADIYQKLRLAGLPVPVVAKTTLPDSGFPALRKIIADKEFVTEDGPACYVLYAGDKLNSTLTRVALAAALMGKELTISGVRVRYSSLSNLIRWSGEKRFDDDCPFVSGNGYIIIPDFDDTASITTQADWRCALDLLTHHVSWGGGLILGKGQTDIDFPGSNFDVLYRNFETLLINR